MIPGADDLGTTDRIWPIIEPILDHAIFDRRDYLVEGVNLRPQTVARFIQEADQPVRACFLGYPDIPIEDKALAVAGHIWPPTDWLYRTEIENVRRYLNVSQQLSRQLRDDCSEFHIPFVDTGADFGVVSMRPKASSRMERERIVISLKKQAPRNRCNGGIGGLSEALMG